ncbi:MAG: response regulator [Deltaproteobacteria bacterium]|nr:response regulator [Deltaproteobacteria bacterium]
METNKPHFLIVDDDPVVCELLSAMLDSFGCEAEVLMSSRAAILMLDRPDAASRFDGIFLDVVMPDTDGIQVLSAIRRNSHTQELPVIMLTAMDTASIMMNSYQKGASYYMTKPFCSHQVVYGLDLVLSASPEGKPLHRIHEIPEDFCQ